MLNNSQIKALRLLDIHTRGSFDVYRLSGDYASSDRQNIMQHLMGAKLPKAKCGITAMREQFEALAHANGAASKLDSATCIAIREDVFRDWARDTLIDASDIVTA